MSYRGGGRRLYARCGPAADDVLNVVELVPTPVKSVHIPVEGLKSGAARYSHVERFRC